MKRVFVNRAFRAITLFFEHVNFQPKMSYHHEIKHEG